MKKRIKKEYVSKLRSMDAIDLLKGQHPFIYPLCEVLSENFPSVSFNRLESARVVKKDEEYRESWNDILNCSGLDKIDFDLPSILEVNKDWFKVVPQLFPEKGKTKWSSGYRYPTVSWCLYAIKCNKIKDIDKAINVIIDCIELDL